MNADDVAVIYIARGDEGGLESARRFVNSYKSRRPGQSHSLKVITKGWQSQSELGELQALFASTQCELLPLADDGFDLGAYFRAARRVEAAWLLCLNTHSEILADDWLKKFSDVAHTPGVGAAGATGSWESHFTDHTRFPRPKNATGKLRRFGELCWYRYNFPPFPNAHLRTNAFMIRRSQFIEFAAQTRMPTSKEKASIIESGRRGLTAFLSKKKLNVLVCGADGNAFAASDWPASQTFFTGRQSNLLVGDNQTRRYLQADDRQKFGMQVGAWGTRSMILSGEGG